VLDSIGIEMAGRPVAVIVTEPFLSLSKMTAKSAGLGTLSLVAVPHPIGGVPDDTIRERASAVIDRVIGALTQDSGEMANSKKIIKPEPPVMRATAKSNSEALRAINDIFYKKRWTDGFPIVPPTEEAVQWMLAGTDRDPDEIVGLVAPRGGKATIRNIAINSVMAGAQPAYLPIITAAVEAVIDPAFASGFKRWGATGMQTTTGPVAPFLIINGPVAHDLNIASGQGCFSRGHRANATIGRALRLVLINTGGSYIGMNDMKCQGSSQEFTFCVAEREDHPVYHQDQNPWKPLHVERGYPAGTSTVTAAAAFPPLNIEDSQHCSPEILSHVTDTMTTLGQIPYNFDWEHVLVLGETHAQCLADSGMSKDDIRQFIYANAVMPWGKFKVRYRAGNRIQAPWNLPGM
jgi:hypothetical protein